jgi:hypothetical protein
VAYGGFKHLSYDHHFLVDGVSGRGLSIQLNRLLVAMHPVILKQARSDFRKVFILHEGKNVVVKPPAVGGNIYRAALALGEYGVFSQELFGREPELLLVREFLFVLEFSLEQFALKGEVPVLRNVLCLSEAHLLRGGAMIEAVDEGRALPVLAVFTFVDVKLASHQLVMC